MNHQPDHRTYGAFGTGTAGFVVGGVPNVAPAVHHPAVAPPVMPPTGNFGTAAQPYPLNPMAAPVAPTAPMQVATPQPIQAIYPLAIPPSGRPACPRAFPPSGLPAVPQAVSGPAPVAMATPGQPATAQRAESIHIRGRFPVRALPAPDNAGDDPRRSSIVRPVASDEKAGVRTSLPPSMATGQIGELRAGSMPTPVDAPATQPRMREPRIHEGRDRLPRIGALSAVGRLPDMFAGATSGAKRAEQPIPTPAHTPAASPSPKSESKAGTQAVSAIRSPPRTSLGQVPSPCRQSNQPTPMPGSMAPTRRPVGRDVSKPFPRLACLDAATSAAAENSIDTERADTTCEPCPIVPLAAASGQREGAAEYPSATPANEPSQPLQMPGDRPADDAPQSHSSSEHRAHQIHRPHTPVRSARHRRPSLIAIISVCLTGMDNGQAESASLRMSADFEFVRAQRHRQRPADSVAIRWRCARGPPHGYDRRCPSSPTILVLPAA